MQQQKKGILTPRPSYFVLYPQLQRVPSRQLPLLSSHVPSGEAALIVRVFSKVSILANVGERFVSVVRAEDSSPSVIRSYTSGRLVNRLLRHCKIWEAARATSAASTFFDPITIGPHGTKFVDGGLRYNKPVDLVEREAKNLWPRDDLLLISIGTGDAPGGSFEGALKDLVDRLKEITTDTQETSNRFLNSHNDMVRNKRLFRYNVNGLGVVGLDESGARSTIVARTEYYLESPGVLNDSEDCINALSQGSPRISAWLGSQNTADENSFTDLLQQHANKGQSATLKLEDGNEVFELYFSLHGQLGGSGSDDTLLRMLKVATGQRQLRFEGHSGTIWAVDFSPNGQLVASGSSDTTIRIWNVETGQAQRKISGHTDLVDAVAFSPDSQLIASGSRDSTIRLWNVATRQMKWKMGIDSIYFSVVTFSPNGQLIGSGSSDKMLRLWDVATGQLWRTMNAYSTAVLGLTFSPDGGLVASASSDKTVELWDIATGRVRKILNGHTDSNFAVAFSSDGLLLASGSHDDTVRVWQVATGQARIFKGHTSAVRAVAFSPGGQLLVSGSFDHTVRVWDVATGQTTIFKSLTYPIMAVAFSSNGHLLACGDVCNTLRVWDVGYYQKLVA